MSNLDIIRAKVIEAVPSKNGKHFFEDGFARCKFCDIPRKWIDRNVHLETQIIEEGGGSSQEVTITEYNEFGKPCTKNIISPIGLADVLLAISKTLKFASSEGCKIQLNVGSVSFINKSGIANWNLLKSLEDQDEPVLSFIASLLK